MIRILAVLFVISMSGAAASAEDLPPPKATYTADGVYQIGGDRVVFKLYHQEGKERHEMSIDGLIQITLLRPDLDKGFIIQPAAKSVVELPLDEVSFLPVWRTPGERVIEPLGPAKEGGEATTKYRVFSNEFAERQLDVVMWVTDDGITMRLEGEVEFEGELESILFIGRDVIRQPLDPEIFDPTSNKLSASSNSDVPETHREVGIDGP